MIQSKQELTDLLGHFYSNFQMPVFLLSHDLTILNSTASFLQLENSYFQKIIQSESINQYKIYTHFYQKETYFFFYFPLEDIEYICIGPYFNQKISTSSHPSDYLFLNHVISYTMNNFLNLPHITHHTCQHILFVYQIITGHSLKSEELKRSFKDTTLKPIKQEKALDKELFQIREVNTHEFSYTYEQKILNHIQNENSTIARLLMNELLQIKDERQLSQNQIQSIKYKLVAAVTVFTRGVIDAGVPIAKAYTLSDIYINKIDKTYNSLELQHMIDDVIVDFTALVKRYKHVQNLYWIKQCKNYISHHLHQSITLDDLASLVHMNPKYLSTQFKKETGQSLKQYINGKKIEEAKFLIKNSDYSLAEIADVLRFSNQSHFNKVFKDITGLTPIQYKNKNYA